MSPELILGRTEGGRLLRNPAIWLSFVLTALWVRSARGEIEGENQLLLLVGFGLLLPGFVMVVAVVLATLRGRIEHTEELLSTLAVAPDRRSVGHAVSTLACGAIGLLATIVMYVALSPSNPLGSWKADDRAPAVLVPRPNIAQMLQGPLAIIAVGAFVIACVRWIPTWLVLVPLAFMVFVQGLFAGIFHSLRASGTRWLYPLNTGVVNDEWIGGCETEDAMCNLPVNGFDATTPWWHLGYLASLAVWFTTVAVLRHRRDRAAWLWFGATSGVLMAFVVAQFLVADGFVGAQ
jgi:hypothetical protein